MEQEFRQRIPRATAARDMLCIGLLFCASLMITNPIGNFPLADDWSYSLAVNRMLDNGDFRPTDWTMMPLITNVAWGTLFCLPAGFSFNALRLSTLVVSLVAMAGAYLLMRDVGRGRWLACLTSLTLAFSPVYYWLSHTFLTDILYMAITVMASLFYVRHLTTGSKPAYIFGTVFVIAATLSRQLAVSVPLAFGAACILKNGISLKKAARAAAPAMISIGCLTGFQQWLEETGRITFRYFMINNTFREALTDPATIFVLAQNALTYSLYLGWFLLPVLLVTFRDMWADRRKRAAAFGCVSAGAVMLGWLALAAGAGRSSLLMPLLPNIGNIILPFGMGPPALRDVYLLGMNTPPALPAAFWIAVTVVSLLGAALLTASLACSAAALAPKFGPGKMSGSEAACTFLLLVAGIYLFPLLVTCSFDRYLVAVVPFFAAGIAGSVPPVPGGSARALRCAAAALVVAFAAYGICGTRDYLAWNRVRWEALRYLMTKKQIRPQEIDGGFEFNGWYLYDPYYEREPNKSFWWVDKDTYLLGFGDMPHYKVVKTYECLHWLPAYEAELVVLRKKRSVEEAEERNQKSVNFF